MRNILGCSQTVISIDIIHRQYLRIRFFSYICITQVLPSLLVFWVTLTWHKFHFMGDTTPITVLWKVSLRECLFSMPFLLIWILSSLALSYFFFFFNCLYIYSYLYTLFRPHDLPAPRPHCLISFSTVLLYMMPAVAISKQSIFILHSSKHLTQNFCSKQNFHWIFEQEISPTQKKLVVWYYSVGHSYNRRFSLSKCLCMPCLSYIVHFHIYS
jgi:hypothetical protein